MVFNGLLIDLLNTIVGGINHFSVINNVVLVIGYASRVVSYHVIGGVNLILQVGVGVINNIKLLINLLFKTWVLIVKLLGHLVDLSNVNSISILTTSSNISDLTFYGITTYRYGVIARIDRVFTQRHRVSSWGLNATTNGVTTIASNIVVITHYAHTACANTVWCANDRDAAIAGVYVIRATLDSTAGWAYDITTTHHRDVTVTQVVVYAYYRCTGGIC